MVPEPVEAAGLDLAGANAGVADGPDEVHRRSLARRELRRHLPSSS
ncbi:hypothetical protein ACI2K4_03855 [Micromonospora sp. NPDC050397]